MDQNYTIGNTSGVNLLIPYLLTLAAGLATFVGAGVVFFRLKHVYSMLSLGLGFAAGTMIYISLAEMIPKSYEFFGRAVTADQHWYTLMSFIAGVVVSALLDWFISHNLFAHKSSSALHEDHVAHTKLIRSGVFAMCAILLHNFPEGLVTLAVGVDNIRFGITMALAIALHNIPEGIAIALPIFTATYNRAQTLKWTLIAALAEPIGALFGILLMLTLPAIFFVAALFGLTAGMMLYISISEMLPLAYEYNKNGVAILGFFTGVFGMAISLYFMYFVT